MIQANELRIDSYYKYPNSEPFILIEEDLNSRILEDLDIIEGVDITPELLQKIDFKFHKQDVIDWGADDDTEEGYMWNSYRILLGEFNTPYEIISQPEGDWQFCIVAYREGISEEDYEPKDEWRDEYATVEELIPLCCIQYIHQLQSLISILT